MIKKEIFNRLRFTLPFLIVATSVLIMSSLNDIPDLNKVFVGFDKLLHLIIYFFYGISIQVMIIGNFPHHRTIYQILMTLLSGIVLAATDEYYQSFQPERYSDIYDFAADTFGILLSLLILPRLKNWIFDNFQKYIS